MENSYEALQDVLGMKLKEIDKTIKQEDSEEVTFLQVIEKEYKENIITTFLKFILDPNRNGVGWLPLKKLLEAINTIHDFEENEPKDIDFLQEHVIEGRRRIDLVIKTKTIWIIIENKINAWEQYNQTKDYFNYIKKIAKEDKNIPKIEYVYLKPNYNLSEPDNNFKILFYSDLVKGLDEITDSVFSEKEKYKFLREFIEHCRRYFMKQTQIDFNNDNITFYIENREVIENLISKYSSESKILYTLFQERIKSALNENNTDEFKGEGKRGWFPIYKRSWSEVVGWKIHYELLESNFFNLLGRKNVEIKFEIHVEIEALKDINIFEEEGIKKRNEIFTDKYNFSTDQEFEESMIRIIDKLKEIDKQYGEKIARAIKKIESTKK